MASDLGSAGIALGASAITGVVAVVVTLAQTRSARALELRNRQADAASEFSKKFAGAVDAIKYSLAHHNDTPGRENARQHGGDVAPLVGPVSLFFGSESDVARACKAAASNLRSAGNSVVAGDWDGAEESLGTAKANRKLFESATDRVLK